MRERHSLLPWNPRQHLTFGGGGGIRTHEGLAALPVFETGTFNHSATPPQWRHFSRLAARGQRHNARQARVFPARPYKAATPPAP